MEAVLNSNLSTMNGGAARRPPLLSSAVLATTILTVTEIMFFCALISAYTVIRAQAVGEWTPPGDIRLPMAATAFNTALLLASGVAMIFAAVVASKDAKKARNLMVVTAVLGGLFVLFQGYEWVKLARYGLTMTESIFGATFFLVIGAHGLHAMIAVLVMAVLAPRVGSGRLGASGVHALAVYWTFVVAIWPILYRMVYWS